MTAPGDTLFAEKKLAQAMVSYKLYLRIYIIRKLDFLSVADVEVNRNTSMKTG
jgi:hypothetical protein